MFDISHLVDVHANRDVVFEIVSTANGISRWWSTTVSGDNAVNGEIVVRFGEKWKVVLQKIDEIENQYVAFRIVEHDSEEWVGTEIHFGLETNDDWTTMKFDHRGWAEKTDFFRFCSAKWVTFLLSIKQTAESGTGMPYPDDTKIGRQD